MNEFNVLRAELAAQILSGFLAAEKFNNNSYGEAITLSLKLADNLMKKTTGSPYGDTE